jgi:hypothetical protein
MTFLGSRSGLEKLFRRGTFSFISTENNNNKNLTIFSVENVCERVSQTALFFFYFPIKQWRKELKRKIQNVFVFLFLESSCGVAC